MNLHDLLENIDISLVDLSDKVLDSEHLSKEDKEKFVTLMQEYESFIKNNLQNSSSQNEIVKEVSEITSIESGTAKTFQSL